MIQNFKIKVCGFNSRPEVRCQRTYKNILKKKNLRPLKQSRGCFVKAECNESRFPDPRDFRIAIVEGVPETRLHISFLSPTAQSFTAGILICHELKITFFFFLKGRGREPLLLEIFFFFRSRRRNINYFGNRSLWMAINKWFSFSFSFGSRGRYFSLSSSSIGIFGHKFFFFFLVLVFSFFLILFTPTSCNFWLKNLIILLFRTIISYLKLRIRPCFVKIDIPCGKFELLHPKCF